MNPIPPKKRPLSGLELLAIFLVAWGPVVPSPALAAVRAATGSPSFISSPVGSSFSSPNESDGDAAKRALAACRVYPVRDLPGSRRFASDFIETMAVDPAPGAKDRNAVWGLTADLSSKVPSRDRAIYIVKSVDDGEKWTTVARLGPKYFDAKIAEGLRNGLAVSPGATDFVVTTQRGAFQVVPRSQASGAIVRPIAGPRVPYTRPKVRIPKKAGDPVRANVVEITADGKRMIVGYGYFDLDPQIFTYRKNGQGLWVKEGPLPPLPTEMDIFSMQFDRPKGAHPRALYVGTGDQAYRLDFRTGQWARIVGVGPDSAIHGMSTVAGLHFAACWAVYNPVDAYSVARVTHASFLLHPGKDQTGPNIRAYGIEVDPARPSREVLTTITGVYTSNDAGASWKRLNDLPEGEYHTAHFNSDGTVIVSGFPGTFLVSPFSATCSPQLRTRAR